MKKFTEDQILDDYFDLARTNPALFVEREGGIEILRNPSAIAEAKNVVFRARQDEGLYVPDLRVGLLANDPHMIVVRDAVRFPDKSLGLYNRVIEEECVAVLPLLKSQLVLIRIFRHGLRDWSLEIPRGARDGAEETEFTARRELKEEIGANICELIPLGLYTPAGSSMSARAHLYAAVIDTIGEPCRAEGISEIKVAGVSEVEDWIKSSRISDGFTLSAFLRARLAGII